MSLLLLATWEVSCWVAIENWLWLVVLLGYLMAFTRSTQSHMHSHAGDSCKTSFRFAFFLPSLSTDDWLSDWVRASERERERERETNTLTQVIRGGGWNNCRRRKRKVTTKEKQKQQQSSSHSGLKDCDNNGQDTKEKSEWVCICLLQNLYSVRHTVAAIVIKHHLQLFHFSPASDWPFSVTFHKAISYTLTLTPSYSQLGQKEHRQSETEKHCNYYFVCILVVAREKMCHRLVSSTS